MELLKYIKNNFKENKLDEREIKRRQALDEYIEQERKEIDRLNKQIELSSKLNKIFCFQFGFNLGINILVHVFFPNNINSYIITIVSIFILIYFNITDRNNIYK